MAAKFYGNKVTKVLHSGKKKDACRMSEIQPERRKGFNDTEIAQAQGYRLCKGCFK
jgi:hypothetical protein